MGIALDSGIPSTILTNHVVHHWIVIKGTGKMMNQTIDVTISRFPYLFAHGIPPFGFQGNRCRASGQTRNEIVSKVSIKSLSFSPSS